MGHEDLSIYIRWETFLFWLLNTTGKFPKRVRFTFSSRLDNLALDVLEGIVEAAYSSRKLDLLKKMNLDLEKMRVLIRICHKNEYIGNRGYEHAARQLHEIGKMMGGWIKEQKER